LKKKRIEGLESDNLFGSPEEDARRRDFTINALFYDPLKKICSILPAASKICAKASYV